MNVWIDEHTLEYCVRFEGKTYRRNSYLAAKELIDGFLCSMTKEAKEKRLDRALYAA